MVLVLVLALALTLACQVFQPNNSRTYGYCMIVWLCDNNKRAVTQRHPCNILNMSRTGSHNNIEWKLPFFSLSSYLHNLLAVGCGQIFSKHIRYTWAQKHSAWNNAKHTKRNAKQKSWTNETKPMENNTLAHAHRHWEWIHSINSLAHTVKRPISKIHSAHTYIPFDDNRIPRSQAKQQSTESSCYNNGTMNKCVYV